MSFEYKAPPIKKKKEPEETGMTRRGFLKAGLAFGTALIGGRVTEDYLMEKKETDASGKEISRPEKTDPVTKYIEDAVATPEQEEIFEGDIKSIESIADILDFDKKYPIKLTPEKMEKVKNYWKEKYVDKKNNLHKDLIDGYREWGYWRPYTEEKFRSVGVPVEYVLLALPESHWRVDARSKKGAVGPYQFMPKTATSLKLKMNRIIDERRDPVKSAEACALVLKELYKVSGDWNVALSGYNGSAAWRFIKEAKNNGQVTNYENFLKYLEKNLNKIKDQLYANKKFRNFSREAKRKIIVNKIGGLSENLNYPPKFHAVKELIKEGKIYEQQLPIKFKEEKIIQTETTLARLEHVVAKGETFFKIAKKLNIPPQELYKYNRKITNIKNLKPGDRIEMPSAKKINKGNFSGSLIAEAKKRGKSEKEMRFLNPHVLDAQAPLPNGTVIRV
jgi:membrane-bound lytic murein transglycosylase D